MGKIITILVISMCAKIVAGADQPSPWPQFRGPNGSGIAEDQEPPVEFGPDKNSKWKVAVPKGLSSPIIIGDQLILTAFENGKLYTIAYRRSDGKETWRAEAPAGQIEQYHKTEGSPAASSPATDGKRIVTYFGSCGLFCYDPTGKPLWKVELPTVATSGNFGSGVSPIVVDGLAILVRDELRHAKVMAVDLATGSIKWEKNRQSPTSYSTPVVWDLAEKQVVTAGHGRLIGYDLQSGVEKWWVNGLPAACATSPVIAKGTLLFAGWSPGAAGDTESPMPTFDALLEQGDADRDGALTFAENEKTDMKGFFEAGDANKDGRFTREEWDAILKILSEGKNRAFALRSGGAGDISTSHVLWEHTKALPYVPSAIAYEGQYVIIKDGGIVTALDLMSGRELYRERIAASGSYYASPIAANGHIYVTSLEDGIITVLKAGTSKLEVVAENPPLGERASATPAIADNTLYVRTDKHLYAFAIDK